MAQQKKEGNGLLESVGNILAGSLKSMKIGKEFKQHLVVYQWPELVGREIANHARAVKLEFKRLFISVSHPAWAEQLKYMEYDLKHKINSHFGEALVQEIVFTGQGAGKAWGKYSPLEEDTGENIGAELKKILLPEEEAAEIRKKCVAIEDAELRKLAERLGLNVHRMLCYREAKKWHICAAEGCSGLCPPEEKYCQGCQRLLRQERYARLQQLLIDMPWARYGDILQELECSEDEFKSQRLILLQRMAGRIDYGDMESVEAKTLVMLYRSIPPEQLNDEVIKKTLHKLRRDLCYVAKKRKNQEKAPKEKK